MDRREFIRRLAQLTTVTAAGSLVGCNPGSGDADGNAVAVVATNDRATGTRQALELIGADPGGGTVFVKPNYNSSDPPPASTHPDVLKSIIDHCQSRNAGDITVGDRAGMEDTREAMEALGVFDMAEDLGFDTLAFDDLESDQWTIIDRDHHHWERGFALPVPVLEADMYLQTCCLKTHRHGGAFTMAIKNNVGLAAQRVPGDSYDYMSELHNSRHQQSMIAEINEEVPDQVILLDAVEGFYERGPEVGPVARFDAVVAGTDPVFIDALGVALLRRHGTTAEVEEGPIDELTQIARCVELEIGSVDPDDFDVRTPDSASNELYEQLLAEL